MAIIVTGGAGFIGSHVCDELLKKGKEVICLDSLNDYYSPKAKIKNITPNLNNPFFHFYTNNIREKEKLKQLFQKFNVEGVIHLAARAGVRESIKDPLAYRDTNIIGTTNLLELSKEFKTKKFVMASSSSVYGNTKEIPFKENANINTPVSPYAASKAACELIAYNYYHLFKMPIRALRFFTVYGPRNRPDMAVYKFTQSIDKGMPVQLYENGELQRDFTYVSDIVEGIIRAYDSCEEGFEVLNLGNSRPIKTKYLVELIEKNLGKKALIENHPKPETDIETTHADLTKTEKLLNWTPSTPIETGIRNFVEWYKNNK